MCSCLDWQLRQLLALIDWQDEQSKERIKTTYADLQFVAKHRHGCLQDVAKVASLESSFNVSVLLTIASYSTYATVWNQAIHVYLELNIKIRFKYCTRILVSLYMFLVALNGVRSACVSARCWRVGRQRDVGGRGRCSRRRNHRKSRCPELRAGGASELAVATGAAEVLTDTSDTRGRVPPGIHVGYTCVHFSVQYAVYLAVCSSLDVGQSFKGIWTE